MIRVTHACAALALALAGCSETTPEGPGGPGADTQQVAQPCVTSADCGFGLSCLGGVCSPTIDDVTPDGLCDSDTDCPDGFGCSVSTGQCIELAPEPSPYPDEETDCNEGDHRPCGSKIGACEYGIQRCIGGQWDARCTGGVGPTDESCNSIDDDCDGDTDEGGDSLCDDGVFCNGVEVCDGSCQPGPAVDCTALDRDCKMGVCDESGDQCVPTPRPDGLTCEDGLFCTVGDTCGGGVCNSGVARECSASGGSCRAGVCDELADACTGQPLAAGTTCDDNQWCTQSDACDGAGNCTGAARNCATAGDACNDGTCDELADACRPTAKVDGVPCNDGQFCTDVDSCRAGTCRGDLRDCASAGNPCNNGACNETADRCEPTPKADGTLCDDGEFCTDIDSCQAGACVGQARDCAGPGCWGVCDEAGDRCVCDACATGSPTADAGPDLEAVPDQTVPIAGGGTDPGGQPLSYTWRVANRPAGSTAPLSDPNVANPTILADVSGDFELCLSVADTDGCASGEDCMTLTVKPRVKFHIELVWDTDASDIDVHYLQPGGTYFDDCASGTDNFYFCMNPDWGPTGPDGSGANDPSLDVDDVFGFGPENINIDSLYDDGNFEIALHYYADKGGGATVSRVRVYLDGAIAFEANSPSMSCNELWKVATVNVSGNGTNVTITPASGYYFFEGAPQQCEWSCDPLWYSDGYCDCGCVGYDPDCGTAGCAEPGCCVASCDYCL